MTDEVPRLRFEDQVEAALADAYSLAYGSEPDAQRLAAIAMRTGTRGPIATLGEAAGTLGVSRERMRQIMNNIQPNLTGIEIPSAAEIARILADRSPVPEPIGVRLARGGRARTSLTGAGYLNVLKIFGTSPKELIGTDLVRVDSWLVEESEVPMMKAVQTASKHTSAFGMTTVEEIRQALATSENPLDPSDIKRLLQREKSIRWTGEWMWVEKDDGNHSNRLINTARSILSVNSPQTVLSIHEGCRRLWKFRKLDILPPVEAMRTFFENSPYFVVKDDLVASITPLNFHDVLGETTVSMIEVLKSQPHQIMDRRTLMEACEEAGIKASTSGIWTTFAEWMEKFGPNVWGLRGSNPSPAVVETLRVAARKRSKSEPKRKQWAWDASGNAVQTFDIRTSFANSGVMSFLGDIHTMLAGQQLSVQHAGTQLAKVKVGAGHCFSWGWAPVLAALKASAGQVMQITVNVSTKTAEVTIGGEELWSE